MPRFLRFALLLPIVCAIDLTIKEIAHRKFHDRDAVHLISALSLTCQHHGESLFQDLASDDRYTLFATQSKICASLVAVILASVFLIWTDQYRKKFSTSKDFLEFFCICPYYKILLASFVLATSGAICNMSEMWIRGYVINWLMLEAQASIMVINIADLAITQAVFVVFPTWFICLLSCRRRLKELPNLPEGAFYTLSPVPSESE